MGGSETTRRRTEWRRKWPLPEAQANIRLSMRARYLRRNSSVSFGDPSAFLLAVENIAAAALVKQTSAADCGLRSEEPIDFPNKKAPECPGLSDIGSGLSLADAEELSAPIPHVDLLFAPKC